VKTCPACGAEVRRSVIKCTTCGEPFGATPGDGPGSANDARLVAPPKAVTPPAAAPAATETSAGTTTATVEPPREAASTAFAPGPRPQAVSSVWATSEAPAAARPAAPALAATTTRTARRPAGPLPDLAGRRALPTTKKRSTRPDLFLMLAAIVVGYAAYASWNTFALEWVQISLSRTDTEGNVSAVGNAAFRATDSMAGTLGQAMVVVLAASALLWLFFGLQRGWSMPWFASPVFAIVASVLAIVGSIVSSVLWFVWRDSMVENASRFGLDRTGLNAILEDVDRSPVVAVQRLGGPGKFMTMMAVALVASCAAWWCYRKRLS
jgi:hypothetical protein